MPCFIFDVRFDVSAETGTFGTSRGHSCKPRALRSALRRIRGFACSNVGVAWRAVAWRNTINLCISARLGPNMGPWANSTASDLNRRLNIEQSDSLRDALVRRGLVRKVKDGRATHLYAS
jgi:hypothetical protein